jgi:hypothetical protein
MVWGQGQSEKVLCCVSLTRWLPRGAAVVCGVLTVCLLSGILQLPRMRMSTWCCGSILIAVKLLEHGGFRFCVFTEFSDVMERDCGGNTMV